MTASSQSIIPGFSDFTQLFSRIIQSEIWSDVQSDFNNSTRVLCVGNGGNLAVCDHGAIDISRLTDKSASAPGSGILASSLINDVSHEEWVRNWLSISLRGLNQELKEATMIIGVSSSGYSKNICNALDLAIENGCKACLITAQPSKYPGSYRTIVLNVDEYHTSEVLTLSLFYQLIHGAGFTCPSISTSVSRNVITDYKY